MRFESKKAIGGPKVLATFHTLQSYITRQPNVTMVKQMHQTVQGLDSRLLGGAVLDGLYTPFE